MKYFHLATDCLLVDGQHDGALYDIHGHRIFLLDREIYRILKRCGRNEPMDDCLGDSCIRVLKYLRDEGLGFIDNQPAYVDKMLLKQPIEWKGICIVPPTFNRVDWSITNQCDMDCSFCCRGGETLAWQGCQTCLRRDRDTSNHWEPGHLDSFIKQICDLGAKALHIRGGNPLLEWERLRKIVQAVRPTPLELILTTPGTGVEPKEMVTLCRENQLRLNIVMFGINSSTVRAVTGRDSVLNKQLALVKELTKYEIPFFMTFLLTTSTQSQRTRILDFTGGDSVRLSFAEIFYRKEVVDGVRLGHVTMDSKPLTPWKAPAAFFFRLKYNSCTHGNFEISHDGKLKVCAGIHKDLADVTDGDLRNALAFTDLYDMWETEKGSIQPCKGCALRYACTDCSVFELEGENNPVIKSAYCPYDPCDDAESICDKNWLPETLTQVLKPSNILP